MPDAHQVKETIRLISVGFEESRGGRLAQRRRTVNHIDGDELPPILFLELLAVTGVVDPLARLRDLLQDCSDWAPYAIGSSTANVSLSNPAMAVTLIVLRC